MIPTSGRTGTCETCASEGVLLTYDHVIPKWLLLDTAKFGINWQSIIENNNLKGKFWKNLCPACNLAKGGNIMYKDPTVRTFMREFLLAIYEKIPRDDGLRKIKVGCGCGRNEPCAVVPAVMQTVVKDYEGRKQSVHVHWKGKCSCGHFNAADLSPVTPQ
jgi:hypothetical protein